MNTDIRQETKHNCAIVRKNQKQSKQKYLLSMNKLVSAIGVATIMLSGCVTNTNKQVGTEVRLTATDPQATPATVEMLNKINKREYLMVGHQDDLSYGHTWNEEAGRSDMKEVSGYYPDVCGWELGGLELGELANLDNVGFDDMHKHMQEVHKMGGINTMTWHSYNLISGNNCWDVSQSGVVAAVLPEGVKHEQYLKWLDKFATFVTSVKDDNGEAIPMLFRPYHELTGSWFWWGADLCTVDEYKQLWRMTHEYLTKEKGVHNLLYVYSTGDFNDGAYYLERYPGDDVVDVLGFDIYQYGENLKDAQQRFLNQLKLEAEILSPIAKEKNKPWAVCEAGLESCLMDDWFTKVGEVIIPTDARYILFWRNAHDQEKHFYVPYVGHSAAPDFKKFVESTRVKVQ